MSRLTRLRAVFLCLAVVLLWQALVPGGVLARAGVPLGGAPMAGGASLSDICFGEAHRAQSELTLTDAARLGTNGSDPASVPGHAGHCAVCGISMTPGMLAGGAALTHVQAPGSPRVANVQAAVPPAVTDWHTPESRGPPASMH